MEPQGGAVASPSDGRLALLDTNVVLALFWFRDQGLTRLAEALRAGRIEWVGTEAMRQELAHVLMRGQLPPSQVGPEDPLTAYDQWVRRVDQPEGSRAWPRCTDKDDQKFVDLAISVRAAWLFTRDRALLKLRNKVMALSGCRVLRPEDWPSSTELPALATVLPETHFIHPAAGASAETSAATSH